MMDYKVTSVPVDEQGRVNPDDVAAAIRDDTILVTIMHSNNEIGTIQPIEEIAQITRDKKVIFHSDAVDSVGVVPIDVQKLGVDLLSFAANQFYGPSGVGGLYIRRGTRIWPLIDGGVQENNKRAGTENLLGIIGMGVAAEIAAKEIEFRIKQATKLKEKLLTGLQERIEDIFINGHPELSLPNLVSVSVRYIEGEGIVLMLDEENIAVSTKPGLYKPPTSCSPLVATLLTPRGPWSLLLDEIPQRLRSSAFWRYWKRWFRPCATCLLCT
jgi:cysteine desulfurase